MSSREVLQARPHPFITGFPEAERRLAVGAPAWLVRMRKEGLERFARLGFPTSKHEAWKHTPIEGLATTPFRSLPETDGDKAAAAILERAAPPDMGGTRIVFVHGRYTPSLSRVGAGLPDEVRVGSLAAAVQHETELVRKHLGTLASKEHPFVALNDAYFADGAFLHVPDGVVVEEPIHIVIAGSGGPVAPAAHLRNLFLLGRNAQATVVETFVGVADAAYYNNVVGEAHVGENASLHHLKFQQESTKAFHTATLDARLDRSASVRSVAIHTGGRLVRNEINTLIDGEGANVVLDGLYMVGGTQLVDTHTIIDHAKPHGTSREFYKGILDGQARAVFHGNVTVRKDAQKTDSDQHNRNLLLSEGALVNTTPQLLINADDVKCAHGSTIGQLDADALFYLKSRGIPDQNARNLLIYAFARELVERVALKPARAHLESLILGQMPEHGFVQEVLS